MFGALESTWEHSVRRKWTTLASFMMQAAGLSALIAASFMWVEGPPKVEWLRITAPAVFTSEAEPGAPHEQRTRATRIKPSQIITPPSIPREIASSKGADSMPTAPDLPGLIPGMGRGSSVIVPGGVGDNLQVVIPPRPVIAKPLLISHLDEASLLHRVQPAYPPIARQARVQGTVELRAIISKTGTVENLVVVSGHPMLAAAAIEAVRQWRYRPYLLNHQPIEVETEITVNFLLSGG
jgi:periplasmic protein TonB